MRYETTISGTLNIGENLMQAFFSTEKNTGVMAYRYGFNGKTNDNEAYNVEGSFQDYGMRMYDTRLARFISVDPLYRKYPELSTYQFASNGPIMNIDIEGLESAPKTRSLTDKEVKSMLAEGDGLNKILLIFKLKLESQTTILVATGDQILKQAQNNKKLSKQTGELKKINNIYVSKGMLQINLKSGIDDITIKGEKADINIKNGATLNFNNLNVKDKKLTDYEGDPIVKDVSGIIKTKGISLDLGTFLPNIPAPDLSFKSKEFAKETKPLDFDTYRTLFDTGVPLLNDNFVDYQKLPIKKNK